LKREGKLMPPRTSTAAELALLGTDHDETVACLIGVPRVCVERKCVEMGILAVGSRRWKD
jgi:hypothetical protein